MIIKTEPNGVRSKVLSYEYIKGLNMSLENTTTFQIILLSNTTTFPILQPFQYYHSKYNLSNTTIQNTNTFKIPLLSKYDYLQNTTTFKILLPSKYDYYFPILLPSKYYYYFPILLFTIKKGFCTFKYDFPLSNNTSPTTFADKKKRLHYQKKDCTIKKKIAHSKKRLHIQIIILTIKKK